MVNLSQDYLIKIAPIPVFELLVNLEYSLPSLIERKNKILIQTDELWKQLQLTFRWIVTCVFASS